MRLTSSQKDILTSINVVFKIFGETTLPKLSVPAPNPTVPDPNPSDPAPKPSDPTYPGYVVVIRHILIYSYTQDGY